MSQQLQITGGAKVRNLEGVLTGTSGVVNALAINVPNGIPQLDGSGKILVSQLPNSVMEYKGTWDASTNTPTLADGTGNQGDVYLCNVAGTVNFGAGPITFFVGDQVIYSGTIWQRASGASGTVTSVAVTESGDSLTITGSPITTSGTINIGFAGTNLQYINGAGNLTTFPSLTGYVPYTGATANVDLGVYDLTADLITGARGSFASNGGSDTFAINHSSGGGIALNITKGGSGEGLYINKTSGSGNAATIIGTLEATTLVKSGGTSTQFLKADGSVDSSTYLTTSAASSTYVPYTGATASVDLGIYSLDASELFTNGNGVYIKKNLSGIANSVDYVALSSSTYKLNVAEASSGSNAKVFNFDFSTLTDTTLSVNNTRTYTLPDLSGTIALLSADQTFTGINSFDYGINYKTGASLANVSGYISQAYATSGTGAGSTLSLKISDGNSVKAINLDFVGSPATYTYTFPAASGTIALTSNLSSYVPYTGATTNVDLGNFTFNAGSVTAIGTIRGLDFVSEGFPSSSIAAKISLFQGGNVSVTTGYTVLASQSSTQFGIFMGSSRNIILDSSLLSTQRIYNLPDTAGTIALTSNLSAYLPLTGGTLTGVLNGTTAAFSDSGTATNTNLISLLQPNLTAYNGPILTLGKSIAINNAAAIQFYYTSNNSSSNSLLLALYGSTGLTIYGNGNGSIAGSFTIGSTLSNGTYTYTLPSATGTLALTSDLGSYLPLTGGTLTGQLYINPTNTATVGLDVASNTIRFRSDNLEGFKRQLTIGLSSGTVINMIAQGFGANYGTDLAFYTATTSGVNGTPAMYITGTNNRIGIKTGTPAYDLDVTGTLRNTTSAYFATSSGTVGIGTITPKGRFDVFRAAGDSGTAAIVISSGESPSRNWSLNTDVVTDGDFAICVSTTTGGTPSPTAGNTKFYITKGGNIGIGSTTPAAKLTTVKLTRSSTLGASSVLQISDASAAGQAVGDRAEINFYTNSDSLPGNLQHATIGIIKTSTSGNETANLYFATSTIGGTPVERMIITSNGVVTITNLGTGAVTATAGVLSTTSDMNLKIEDGFIDNALEKVLKLTPRYFLWKEESGLPTDLRQLGFYAQEVNEALGEEVANTPKDKNQNWGIYDRGMIAMLTKAMQEQQTQIDQLKTQIQTLLNK